MTRVVSNSPFKAAVRLCSPLPSDAFIPPRRSKAWKSQAALQQAAHWEEPGWGLEPVPAVGYGVDFLQWYLDCPVVPPVYLQKNLKESPGEYPGCSRSCSQEVPTWALCNSCVLVDLFGVTALLPVILLTGAGTGGHLIHPFWKANLIMLSLRTLCPALYDCTWDRLCNGWSCAFAGCRNHY